MGASHARQRRPLFPVAWQAKPLADQLRVDRSVIYEALRNGDLIAYRVGIKNLILTTDVVEWIKRHRKVKRHEHD